MRYLPQTKESRKAMMDAVGVDSVDALYKDVPAQAFIDGLADLPMHMGELEVERKLSAYANENRAAPQGPFFLGAGVYYHHVPSTVDYVIQRSEFLTAYTPYQPEIAQGTLTAIFEFQTFIARLTGQDIANASLYDGATATAEAALMAMRVTRRNKICVANALHFDYRAVLKSYMGNHEGTEIFDGAPDEQTACVILQSPDFFGKPHAYEDWRKKCDETGALLVVVVNEIISLGLLPAPDCADIVCGEAQSIGLPMSFGGPHLGFFACKEKFLRQMPGRLCGQTLDADGKRGYVLTLNTREQHIRREKATSNICTNQGLCALAFTVHMALLGEDGFRRLARLNHEAACKLADALSAVDGVTVPGDSFFNEFVIELSKPSAEVVDALAARGIIAGYALDDRQLLVTATEMAQDADIKALAAALQDVLN
ncbi:MAG: aminomethyl-transferring glycine dehydrogenase subunit GcvPA [Rhodospirillales bacterium]|nr:aminomethyl-transferring glycine dehydrogenase subunit GcvPA [Rhodospirillales bacterium]MCB9996794.1 aminomethyl-transferring glycine dehydrogenase subunit GcvPA [Rhodospirillales bacterium]